MTKRTIYILILNILLYIVYRCINGMRNTVTKESQKFARTNLLTEILFRQLHTLELVYVKATKKR